MSATSLFSKEAGTRETNLPRPSGLANIINGGTIVIDRDLARLILDEANYDRQRPVRADALARAVELLSGDDFVDGHQIWFARLPDGRLILIDGQHRISATYELSASRRFVTMVVDCANMDQVHAHYCRFDRFGRRRSDAEAVSSLGLSDDLTVPKQVAMAAWKAAAYIADDFPFRNNVALAALKTDKAKADYIKAEFADQVRQYAGAVAYADIHLKRGLLTPSVVAVALLTLRDQPAKAKEFWDGVAMDDGLRRGDPRHTLVKTLRDRPLRGSHSEGGRIASTAWNAYYSNRELTFIRIVIMDVKINGVRRSK